MLGGLVHQNHAEITGSTAGHSPGIFGRLLGRSSTTSSSFASRVGSLAGSDGLYSTPMREAAVSAAGAELICSRAASNSPWPACRCHHMLLTGAKSERSPSSSFASLYSSMELCGADKGGCDRLEAWVR